MNFDLPQFSAGVAVAVPVIVSIVQAIKMTGRVPDKYAPICSIIVGIIIGIIAHGGYTQLGPTILSGVMYGLMASGLYSGIKVTMPQQNSTSSTPNNSTVQPTTKTGKKINSGIGHHKLTLKGVIK